ncbi:MAG: HAMP domain-containing histidine kinase [Deltaproteobacteria bacterium]|nr:MAG: HAMP domain-containing histidine kinase [Deltaproteobacteria bacterium]
MVEKVEQLSRVKEIAFMGKVAASLSHEIKNTLAIINESVGLMGDLLGKDAPGDWPPYSRFTNLLASIEEQVQRSADIVKRLNQFAHSMDKSLAELDLNEKVRKTVMLAQRFATLRRVNLETQLASEPLHLLSDPFRLLYVIFGLIERAINSSPKDAEVKVKTERSGERLQVTVTDQGTFEAGKIRALVSASPSPEAEQGEADLALLAQTIEALGGTIAAEQEDGGLNKVVLSFPASMPII